MNKTKVGSFGKPIQIDETAFKKSRILKNISAAIVTDTTIPHCLANLTNRVAIIMFNLLKI